MQLRSAWGFFLLGGVILQCGGCATNPYTNRWQLLMVPQSYEEQLGAQAYRDVLSDPNVQVSKDPAETEPVRRVARRIIEGAKHSKYAETAKEYKWDMTVIKNDRTQNAFALPGGKIAVYTGLFPVANNEAGLAAIIGHEVVHALARHGAERMSQGVLAQAGLIGASVAMQTQGFSPVTSQAAMSALGSALKSASCCPTAGRTSPRPTTLVSSLLRMQAIIRKKPSRCGGECSSFRRVGNRLNFYRPTQAMRHALNGSLSTCPKH